jgi:hypothetical protein
MLNETNTVTDPSPADADLRAAVIAAVPTNPALQRLQQRVLERADTSEAITSYDRMHHRHSRS